MTALSWPELTTLQTVLIAGVPLVTFAACVVVLGYLWEPKALKSSRGGDLEAQVRHAETASLKTGAEADYGTGGAGDDAAAADVSNTLLPGQVAGTYDEAWTSTFDFAFFIGMCICLVALIFWTLSAKPALMLNGTFWMLQVPKLGLMMLVSSIGGLIARYFCIVDDQGYIVTNTSSHFKVNYTRKLQHFAAYAVPLFVSTPAGCDCDGTLETAWGYWVTLLGFLVLIKPVRENISFFMLQFNSLDRPEDRPNTNKWIIAGNIVPGIIMILFFQHIFAWTGQANLVFIFVFITGIGDGLAEPVGITMGRHKYRTASCFSTRKYTRSWEGSACVLLSAMLFTACQWYDFKNSSQFWFTMLVMPPAMAYAEATSPHTMDTPFLMGVGGLILYVAITYF
jgi:dolichol kinase